MSLKQCEKCSEMVDEAKAFCPDCGHPFVEERVREELTEHDSFAGTIKLTQSGYNILLSEMELDITEQPAVKSPPAPHFDQPPARVESSSRRLSFIIVAAVFLLLAAAVVLVFLVAQPFST